MMSAAAAAESHSTLLSTLLWSLYYAWLVVEVAFYFVFHLYMVPRANQRTEPKPYRDYGKERHRLLNRILNRIEDACTRNGSCLRQALEDFLLQWFERLVDEEEEQERFLISQDDTINNNNNNTINKGPRPRGLSPPVPRLLHTESSMSSTASDDVNSISSTEEGSSEEVSKQLLQTLVKDMGKEEMDEFFAWAFFAKDPSELLDWEQKELQLLYDIKAKRFGAVYASGRLQKYRARRLSIDHMNALHRPLLVYVIVWFWQCLMGIFLRAIGFQRVVSQETGLTGWYRPAKKDETAAPNKLLPFLFFHGLAPGGLLFYLPMVLCGFLTDGRAAFLFENPNISCSIGFNALTEEETVQGVSEIVSRFCSPDQGVTLCGHSFGSVPMTWLLHSSKFRHKIRQFVLLDPVTILLSDPDVMVQFLYCKESSGVRIFAGSELYTVMYLRRHFSWYNSELWMDDLPKDTVSLVALSEMDAIVNAPKVKEHLDSLVAAKEGNGSSSSLEVCYWKGVGHASCIAAPDKWRNLKESMLRQELGLVRGARE